ncbi:MAG: serine/threonine protein kinase [Deltaproteobacteria bacterium]|nr:serine/threonine protein kinase [Deltaproteobacteria bacterium]
MATKETGGDGAPADEAERGEPPPEIIAGRYHVTDFIGAGGYGAVYKAVDQRLQKTVAVKLLTGKSSRSEQTIRRFRVEALAASRLTHPAIVAVTDFDVLRDGRPFLVMEYVVGETLDRHLATAGRLEPARAARIARVICSALAAAHRDQVIHRDLKPANIIVGEVDGELTVKILDFGVAKLAGDPEASGLTGAGWLLGTPAYMAPEQVDAEVGPVDGRADIYALGIMLYEMMTGRNPYTGRSVTEALLAHLREDVPRPSELHADVPAVALAQFLKAPTSRDKAEQAAQRLENCRARATIPVRVSSMPPSAAVYLVSGGQRSLRGRTPTRLELQPGTFELRVEHPGYQGHTQKVVVEIGTRPDVDFTLERLSALRVEAETRRAATRTPPTGSGSAPPCSPPGPWSSTW